MFELHQEVTRRSSEEVARGSFEDAVGKVRQAFKKGLSHFMCDR